MNNPATGEPAKPPSGLPGSDPRSSAALWKLLWDFDPNGLLVLDDSLRVIQVNPAMCEMLQSERLNLLGRKAVDLLGDVSDFQRAYDEQREIIGHETSYPRYDLYARKVIFPVPGQNVVAGIFVDLTREWRQRNELEVLRSRTAQEVRNVVDKQMRVAQEIAGLLGETTAETKVSLLRLLDLLGQGDE
jgi:PAS domain-containing protein